jgi:Prohead core protein serine protease
MKLITEVTQEVKYITEKKESGGKSFYIEGIFMQTEEENRNNRIYRKPIVERELIRYQSLINEKRALGELGHPPNPSINLNQVSHLITNLRFEGNDVYGKAKILDTPMGKIAQNFIEEGVRLGVSSRGLGSVKQLKDGVNEVQDDFHLATVDIVADPSAPNAFVQGIMEDASWLYVEGKGWVMEQIKKEVKKAKLSESKKLDLFNQFITLISKK